MSSTPFHSKLHTDKEIGKHVFEDILANAEASNVVENGELDRLIRQGRITPEMATSVINDTQYREDILKALIQTAMVAIQHRGDVEELVA